MTRSAARSPTIPNGSGIVETPAARRRFGGLADEAMLKRMPRGFSDAHPAALSPRLPDGLEKDFRLTLAQGQRRREAGRPARLGRLL